jgi:hypothetical protein
MIIPGVLCFSTGGGNGFTSTGTITINHTKCGTADSANFTVMVSITNTKLKTVANGGQVTNASGFDIVLGSNSSLSPLLNWTVKFWDGTAGTWIAYALLPNVTHAVDTVFNIGVGNSSITTFQGGTTGVAFPSDYLLAYLFPDGSTLNANDSTANAQNLTNSLTNPAAGLIDGCASFNSASPSVLNLLTPNVPTGSSPRSVSILFQMGANQTQELGGFGDNAGLGDRFATFYTLNTLYCECSTFNGNFPWTFDTNWHHMLMTYSGGFLSTGLTIYFDGVAQPLSFVDGTLNTTNAEIKFGGIPGAFVLNFTGLINEYRLSNVVKTASWAITEANNLLNVSTFLTVVL